MDLSVNELQNVPESIAEEGSQHSEEEKHEETQQKLWPPGKKHVKKFHYEQIAKQIEFYFSPSNLAKDGFMAKLIKEDPYIPISVFLTFNKIKNFLNGGPEGIIKKALSRSTLLELSEDQTKVRRREDAPMKTQEEIDDSTLYIEQIPINSTHDSISSIFSRFGKVNYVSLPRYKKSRQIKQFGFVEFDDKESIMKAINCFKKVDGVLQHASIKAENLLSITTFEKDDVSETTKERTGEQQESDEPPTKKARIDVPDEEPENKVEEEVEVMTESKETEPEEDQVCPQESESDAKDDVEDAADESMKEEDDKDESAADDPVKKKKNRHHKKKSGQKAFFDERIMAIKIMRKKEWKKMRNAYLTLERQKAKEIKKILRDSYNKRHNNKIQECQKFSPANTASPRINFYGSPNDRVEEPVDAPYQQGEVSSSSGLAFVPGVIVNIKFREPCLEPKELKKEFKQFTYCNYVDIVEGGAQCYIRVDAPSSAQELLNQYSSCEYETEILKDEAEKEYWKKIFEKRDNKKSKESPKKEQPVVKRRRGREKLLEKISKAAQHIRFDEAEDIVE